MGLIAAAEAPLTGTRSRMDRALGVLVGSRCTDCTATSWPGRAVCHRCASAALVEHAFPPVGSLLSYTRVWVPRPGLEAGYVLGQVRLVDGPLVFTHVRELPPDLTVPAPVHLVVGDCDAVPSFWFEPTEGG